MQSMGDGRPIVLDSGSSQIRAGFADESKPAYVCPPVIGRRKQDPLGKKGGEFVGEKALKEWFSLNLGFPNQLGVVNNWDDMEVIWGDTFSHLEVSSEDQPIMLTESPCNPDRNREMMTEIMFETFKVPLLYTAMDAAMALYHSGRINGLVLSSGQAKTYAVPFNNCHAVRQGSMSINMIDVDGDKITEYLMKILDFQSLAERKHATDIKETICYVALDFDEENSLRCSLLHDIFENDEVYRKVNQERFRGPEHLFQPKEFNINSPGIHEITCKAIMECTPLLRKDMFANIVLAGGNTMFPGIAERLQTELAALAPEYHSKDISITAAPDRDMSVWLGAAKFVSQPDFTDKCISKKDYEEHGRAIVHRKCPL